MKLRAEKQVKEILKRKENRQAVANFLKSLVGRSSTDVFDCLDVDEELEVYSPEGAEAILDQFLKGAVGE